MINNTMSTFSYLYTPHDIHHDIEYYIKLDYTFIYIFIVQYLNHPITTLTPLVLRVNHCCTAVYHYLNNKL